MEGTAEEAAGNNGGWWVGEPPSVPEWEAPRRGSDGALRSIPSTSIRLPLALLSITPPRQALPETALDIRAAFLLTIDAVRRRQRRWLPGMMRHFGGQ